MRWHDVTYSRWWINSIVNVGVILAIAGFAVAAIHRVRAGAASEVSSAEGFAPSPGDALIIEPRARSGSLHTPGRPLALVVFRTDCPVCASLRDTLRILLPKLRSHSVVTISPEPDSLLTEYWEDSSITAVGVTETSLHAQGIIAVPYFLVISASGTIERAGLGADALTLISNLDFDSEVQGPYRGDVDP